MNSRLKSVVAGLFIAVLAVSFVAGGEIKLPAPKTDGGKGIFDALKSRASATGNAFPTGAVSQEELSTILWAASGLNRPGKGWTVPMAMGSEPYARVYVASKDGVYLYSWKSHALIEVSKENIMDKISPQKFATTAPYVLVFTSDDAVMSKLPYPAPPEVKLEMAAVAVGAMTQDVYLAADALGIGGRYAMTMNADLLRKTLALPEADKLFCIMPIGKR